MPNYVLAQESNRANIPDRLWYAMEETDLEDIAANENIATGDKVYVIKQGKTYIFGEDSEWYVSGKSSGGGGTSVDVEPLAVNANGTYTAAEGTAYSPVTVDVPGEESFPTYYGLVNNLFENEDVPYGLIDRVLSGELLMLTTIMPTVHYGTINRMLISSVNMNQIFLTSFYSIGGDDTFVIEYDLMWDSSLQRDVLEYIGRSYKVQDEGYDYDRTDEFSETTSCITTFIKNPFYAEETVG